MDCKGVNLISNINFWKNNFIKGNGVLRGQVHLFHTISVVLGFLEPVRFTVTNFVNFKLLQSSLGSSFS